MSEVVLAFGGGDGFDDAGDSFGEGLNGAGGGFAQSGLDLAESWFDGIEVGTVGGQIFEPCAGRRDGLFDASDLVARQIVHDDDVVGRQGRRQALLDIGQEGLAIHGAIEHHGRRQAGRAQGGGEGDGLPMAMGGFAHQSLAFHRPAIAPDHVGRSTGLVDEHQLARIEPGLTGLPGFPSFGDIRPVLLAGVQSFF